MEFLKYISHSFFPFGISFSINPLCLFFLPFPRHCLVAWVYCVAVYQVYGLVSIRPQRALQSSTVQAVIVLMVTIYWDFILQQTSLTIHWDFILQQTSLSIHWDSYCNKPVSPSTGIHTATKQSYHLLGFIPQQTSLTIYWDSHRSPKKREWVNR